MRTTRVLAIIGLLSLASGGCLIVVSIFPTLLRGPVALLVTKDEPMKSDLIVMLSGQPVSRALAARDLYMAGLSRKVLIIPEPPNPLSEELAKLGFEKSPYSTSQRILMASGVPLSAVDHLPSHAEGTEMEARLVEAYAAKHGTKSVLLVTSPLSSRRQCWLFKRALPSVGISCQPSAYELIEYHRRLTLWIINEYLKIAANTVGIY